MDVVIYRPIQVVDFHSISKVLVASSNVLLETIRKHTKIDDARKRYRLSDMLHYIAENSTNIGSYSCTHLLQNMKVKGEYLLL